MAPPPPRQGEIVIMDFLQLLGMSNSTLVRMNNLRLRASRATRIVLWRTSFDIARRLQTDAHANAEVHTVIQYFTE